MTQPGKSPFALGQREFRALLSLVEERAGLAFDEEDHYLFERRLGERIAFRKLLGFGEYVDLVQRDPEELEAVFDALTTKETYFFRQDYQLDAFMAEVVPQLVANCGEYRRLTVWSAGCSSGEEAYTLAILLSESPLLRGFNVHVVGTDLCQSNIDAARRGEYRKSAFRTLPEGKLERYFEESGSGYRVAPAIRRMCHFSRVNLVNPFHVRAVGRVDVVFCRNVLIYFGESTRKKVTDLLFERILPGGFLFLGHTESLLSAQTHFEVVHLASDLAYRRPIAEKTSGTRGDSAGKIPAPPGRVRP